MSSERIAKALKGAGLSPEERIVTAIDAWQNDSLVFPNKDDFLLEWLCSALVKSKPKTPTETVVTQIAYWDLLQQLLTHYVRRAEEIRRSPPTIRVQLINALGMLLSHIKDRTLTEQDNALLDKATISFELLFSSTFSLSYRPTFEQTNPVVDQLLEMLTAQTDNTSLTQLAAVLLKRYHTQIAQSPNQKKVFAAIVGKPFPAILSIRRRIASMGSLGRQVAEKLTDILTLSLYHPDTILEYMIVFKSTAPVDKGHASASFVYKLFQELSELLKTEETIQDVLDVLPILYARFVPAFRNKRGSATGQDPDRIAEFGFLVECHAILERNLKPVIYLDTLYELLKKMSELNVIVSRNDDISRSQYAFLEAIADNAIGLLRNPDGVSQGTVMRLLDILLHIDMTVIEARTGAIWPFLIEPSNDSMGVCLELALSILRVYSATRQLDVFLNDMSSSLHSHASDDLHALLSMPLFSRRFLDEFSQLVTKTSTAAQSLAIFDFFANEMYASIDSPSASSCPTSRLLSVFFARFIDAVSLSQHQRHTFEERTRTLLNRYLKPSLKRLDDIEAYVLPAIQIHSALTNSMTDVYWTVMDDDTREWMAETLCTIFKENIKTDSPSARCAVVLSATACLQHAYYISLGSESGDIPIRALNLVSTILNYVLDEADPVDTTSIWDGSLLHLNKGAVKIACWKLLTDDWFDVICRCQALDCGEKLASLVLLPVLETPPETVQGNVLSLCTISQRLLCTASLYEASFLKEYAMKIVVDALAKFFRQQKKGTAAGKLAALFLDEDTRYCHWKDKQITELAKLLGETLRSSRPNSDIPVVNADRILNVLLLFPNEYYRKEYRTALMKASLLIDGCSYTSHGKGTHVSLLSRTLYLRCIAASTGSYVLKLNADILAWQLDSVALSEPSVAADLFDVTNAIDKNLLRAMLATADNDSYANALLRATFTKRAEYLKSGRDNSAGWAVNVVESITSYLKAHPARRSEFDPKSIVYAADTIPEISQYVINSLKKGQAILLDDPQKGLTILTKPLFTLASLLQGYAALLKTNGEKTVDAVTLSRSIVQIASPFTTLIQRSLRDRLDIHDRLLGTTTAFVPSLCKAVAQYQRAYVTERVLAVIWFIVSQIFESDKKSVNEICMALSSWVKTLDPAQYNVVLCGFVAQAEQVTEQGKEQIYITLLAATVEATERAQYAALKKQLNSLIQNIVDIGRKSKSIEFTRQALLFLANLTANNDIVIPNFTLSKIMGCIVQLTNFSAAIEKGVSYVLVDTICSILQNIVRYHREELVDVLPPFIALIQAVLHCFQSTHLALTSKSQKERPRTYLLLAPASPLDVTTAEKLSRVFESMSTRLAVEGRNKRISQQVQNQLISKHAPFILLEYFTIQAHPAKSITQPQVKAALEQGLYCLMDMVAENQRQMVLVALNEAGKLLFKNFYNNWKENHLYKGQ